MTSQISLPFWPNTVDNIHWSADNLIAVAGGDVVAVLVPRPKAKWTIDSLWDTLILKVNEFSPGDVLVQDPVSFKNFALGEEAPSRQILTLDWSPLGLAKFDACILGVLHSNYVLALWECRGTPGMKDQWNRCLIVNHAVQKYYDSLYPADVASQSRSELRQICQRIRAFAWFPSLPHTEGPTGSAPFNMVRPQHHLAISTEAGDLLILSIQSPHNVSSPYGSLWHASVVHRIACATSANGVSRPHGENIPSSLAAEDPIFPASERVSIDQIATGAPGIDGTSVLAYIRNGELSLVSVHISLSKPDANAGSAVTSDEMPVPSSLRKREIIGPLRFVPKTNLLTCFSSESIIAIDVHQSGTPSATTQEHHLDGRWDGPSGLAFTAGERNAPILHIVSQSSFSPTITNTLSLPFNQNSKGDCPSWHRAIRKSKRQYGAENNLAGHVQVRTWGITASPLGDFVATCSSFCPSDSAVHIQQADQRCAVNITSEWNATMTDLLPSNGGLSLPSNIPVELACFNVQFRLEQIFGTDFSAISKDSSVRQSVQRAFNLESRDEEATPASINHSDVKDAASLLTERLYLDQTEVDHRLSTLTDYVLEQSDRPQLSPEGYLKMVRAILQFAMSTSTNDHLRTSILQSQQTVLAKLDARLGKTRSSVSEGSWHEQCSICSETMQFEALKWTRCPRGHRFTRCSLTFLTILQPGNSKTCRICNTQYLDLHKLADADQHLRLDGSVAAKGKALVREAPSTDALNGGSPLTAAEDLLPASTGTFAKLLEAACNRCIFCGGRFISS